jgi:hypothetical protein
MIDKYSFGGAADFAKVRQKGRADVSIGPELDP